VVVRSGERVSARQSGALQDYARRTFRQHIAIEQYECIGVLRQALEIVRGAQNREPVAVLEVAHQGVEPGARGGI
jgi:hypothetical protein